ncbi:MAG: twitching motility protein [Hydrogenobacter thermophilus]|nr:twitching motility protein [Hydrogenobacter thermophilus]
MNYVSQILSYISSTPDITEIYLVPKAPPVDKKDGKLIKITDNVFTPEDVRDTLLALKSYASPLLGPLGSEGTFSFGIQNVGRLRVSYVTQRGSYVVNIVKIPYQVPLLENVCQDPKTVQHIDELIRLYTSGIVLVLGNSHARVSTFVYSFLQHISRNYQKIILVLEKPLSFLLKHDKSLVIQREVGLDTPTFEEGLRDVAYVNPDIVYVSYRDILLAEEVLHIINVVDLNTLVIFHSPYMSEEAVLKSFERHKKLVRSVIKVGPSDDGKLSIAITNTAP